MDIVAFINYLKSLDIRLWVDHNQLRYNAPKGVLTPDLRTQLTEFKEDILALLGSQNTNDDPNHPPPIVPVMRNQPFPLSFTQQGVWLRQQLDSDSAFYNMPSAIRLTGKLNIQALEASLHEVVKRHEILRAIFPAEADPPQQMITPPLKNRLPIIDLQIMPDKKQREYVNQLLTEEAKRPFDLTTTPFRVALLHLEKQAYILFVTVHHLVYDNWSAGIIFQELTTLYKAFSAGRPSPLPDLSIQYIDFACWQREWLTDWTLASDLAYWEEQLGGELPKLALPTDHPKLKSKEPEGSLMTFRVSQSLRERLELIGQQEGATLFMTLLAAFYTLLYRYTSQEDIIIGTSVAKRSHTQLEGMVGLFADFLVLRANLSGDLTFRQLLRRVRALTLQGYTHQNVPFEKLVQAIKPPRDLSSNNPFFSAFFNLLDMPKSVVTLPDLVFSMLEIDSKRVQYDLALTFFRTDDGLEGELIYNNSLFYDSTITQMLAHFHTLLKSIADEPDWPLSEQTLTDEIERKLLQAWNNTKVHYPDNVCLHQLVETQTDLTPDRIAVVCEGSQITYQELNGRANQLAMHLRIQGVGADDPVLICTNRSIEMVIGVLGILKAGGAYVPVDPTHPQERLELLTHSIKAHILISQTCFQTLPITESIKTIYLDRDWSEICQQAKNNLDNMTMPDNLAYIIHTSGSTGVPKGVALPHRPLVNLLAWHVKELSTGVRTLQFASLGFDVSFHEIFSVCASGGTLCIINDIDRVDVVKLICYLGEHAVEKLTLPIMLLQQLADNGDKHLELLNHLQDVIATGERLILHPAIADLFANLEGCTLHNHYGPSETHLVTTYTLPRSTHEWSTLPSIGRPISNVQIHILDGKLQPVPIGVPGELYLGGVCLARGYHGQPHLTADKFIPDPFSDTPGARLYKSGDLVRYGRNGDLEFLGRVDRQVKILGQRIEPGEIEVVLCQHPAIQEAVVILQEDPSGDKYLVAYVVVAASCTVESKHIYQYLREHLPLPFIPRAFIQLDRLPLNKSGKIDRQQLPALEIQANHVSRFPKTALEEKLTSLWRNLLKIEEPDIDDDFFELGGHSLKAASLVAAIHREFDVKIPLREMFASPTIRDLGAYIAQAKRQQFSSIPKVEKQDYYPTSSAQKRIFILQLIDAGGMAYNLFDAFYAEGSVEKDKVEATFQLLVDRHEALRTSFFLDNHGSCQRIHERIDLTISYYEAVEDEIANIAQGFFTPFNLEQPPLFKVGLIKLDTEKFIFLFNMHHIIGDGISLGTLIREFMALYEGRELDDVAIQYKDFAVWHNKMIASGALQSQEAYWLDQFATAVPTLDLPTDYRRPSIVGSEGGAANAVLDRSLTANLKQMAATYNVTLYTLLFTIYSVLLARYTGQEDCVIGSPVNGRTHADLANTIGMFVNTLAIRCLPENAKPFDVYLLDIKNKLVEAFDNQDYPFEMLVERIVRQRDTSRNPLVETTFDLWRHEDIWIESSLLKIRPYAFESTVAKLDLLLDALDKDGEIHLNFQFSTQLFSYGKIQRMAGHFEQICKEIIKEPTRCLGDINLLTEAEQRQILSDFNHQQIHYPNDLLIHGLIEEQAETFADKVVVVFNETCLTYSALNQRANQMAYHLRQTGLGRGTKISLLLNRSLELIVATLAVLKAGGTYIPIDPNYPEKRIRFILEDSDSERIITDQQVIASDIFAGEELSKVIDILDENITMLPAENLTYVNDADDCAYVIYTSGTSGNPKGVMVSHDSLVNASFGWQQAYRFDQIDLRLLQIASAAFDVFTGDFVRTLTSGGCMIICPASKLVELPELYRLIYQQHINFLESTPSLIIPLMDYVYQQDLPIENMELLVIGSDSLNLDDYGRLLNRFGDQMRIINSYGVTEATIDSTYYEVKTASQLPGTVSQNVPIGRPLPNVAVYVLNAYGNLQPIGVPGELYIGGRGVAQGYHKRPQLSESKFVSNPFLPGEYVYKSGDHARWLSDGSLEFLGRLDSQVKIGGYRIEVGEIESCLRLHPAVKEAVVVAPENKLKQNYLVGYITLSEETKTAIVRQYLYENLPHFMVPQTIRVIDVIPMTPNGKVDRRALVVFDDNNAEREEYFPPQNEVEAGLIQIWQDILVVSQISITDSFFDLGGNSLSILSLYNRIHAQYDVDVSVADLFSCHTIKMLAKRIHQRPGQYEVETITDDLDQRIYNILDDFESGQIDLTDADAALDSLMDI